MVFSGAAAYMQRKAPPIFKRHALTVVEEEYFEDEDIQTYTVAGTPQAMDSARELLEVSDKFGGAY